MGIVYASRNRQERKGGVRWNRLSNRCQRIRSSPLLGFRQGVKDGSARTAAEHLPSGSCRLIPLRPGPVAVRVAVQGRARQFLRSLNPRKRQHSAEGVGFDPTESLRPQRFSRWPSGDSEPRTSQCSRTFSAFAVPTHPSSSRVVSTRWLYAWRTGREYVDERQAGTDEWTRPRVASRRRGGARACDPHLLVRLVVRLRFGST